MYLVSIKVCIHRVQVIVSSVIKDINITGAEAVPLNKLLHLIYNIRYLC